MNKKSEKKRCSNFSSFEIDLLIKLVEERRAILKCPKLDAITVEKRNTAWREITQLFNSNEAVHVFRDEDKLKKKYSNIRCERNKMGKQAIKTEEATQIAQANDNAVEIVKKEEHTDENSSNNLKIESKENTNKNKNIKPTRHYLTDESSADLSDNSSMSAIDFDEAPPQPNGIERELQNAADKFSETNNNLAVENDKLEMEIIAIEHEKRMQFLHTKHEHELKRIEFHRIKHDLELELTNAELKAKRRKLKKKSYN